MRLFPAVLVLPSLMLAGCVATGPYYPQEVGRVYGYDSYSTYDPYPPTYYGPDVYYYSYRPSPDYYYRPGYGYYRPQVHAVRPSYPKPPDRGHDHGRNDHDGHDHGSPRPPRPDRPDRPDRPERPDRPQGGLWGGIGRGDDGRPTRPPQAQPPSRPDRPERPNRPERPDRGPGLGWGSGQRPESAPSRPAPEIVRPPRQEQRHQAPSGGGDGQRRRGWGRGER